MKKKILLSVLVLALCAGTGAYFKANAEGWLWGGTDDGAGLTTGVGWINTSCSSQVDTDGDNIPDADLMICDGGINDLRSCNGPGAVAVCTGGVCANACTVLSGRGINYGVSIPGSGAVTGYAWSENLGYIDFAPAGPYPTVATGDDYAFPARRDGDFLRGWARIVGIKAEYEKIPSNSGGWQGWIRLSSNNDPTQVQYAVDIAKMDGTGANPTYAWSNELGWIDFSRAKVAANNVLKICLNSCNNPGGRITGDYYLSLGDTRDLKACWSASSDCDSNEPGVDVTAEDIWDSQFDDSHADNAVNLGPSGSNPMVMTAVTAGKSEDVWAESTTYGRADFKAHVTEPGSPEPATPAPSPRWKEVAP